MPWKVMKEDGQYCVFDKNGKKMHCYDNEAAAEKYKAALYANAGEKLEEISSIMLEAGGPVVLGIAATNRPHLSLPPMSVVDMEGSRYLRVPFLRKGIFKHPNGKLVFDDKIMSQMLENHRNKESYYGVSLDLRHRPELGALAWFDEQRGGFIRAEEDPQYGKLLVGYGRPTSEQAVELVEKQQYVFASVEFHPRFPGDNLVTKLSTDELEEIEDQDLVTLEVTEEEMEEKTITLEEYNSLTGKAEELELIKTKVSEGEQKIASLEAKLVELEKQDEEVLPEAARVRLEAAQAEIERLKKGALATHVELIISRAESYRDQSGRGHSPVLLEIARKAMLTQPVEVNGGETIKLESKTAVDVAGYYRQMFAHLLEVLPGQVQLEARTEADDKRELELGEGFTKDQLKGFWD